MRRGTLNWQFDDDSPFLSDGDREEIVFSKTVNESSSQFGDGRHLQMFDRCVTELREKLLAVVNRGKAKEGVE